MKCLVWHTLWCLLTAMNWFRPKTGFTTSMEDSATFFLGAGKNGSYSCSYNLRLFTTLTPILTPFVLGFVVESNPPFCVDSADTRSTVEPRDPHTATAQKPASWFSHSSGGRGCCPFFSSTHCTLCVCVFFLHSTRRGRGEFNGGVGLALGGSAVPKDIVSYGRRKSDIAKG